jgi:hypothetical protein
MQADLQITLPTSADCYLFPISFIVYFVLGLFVMRKKGGCILLLCLVARLTSIGFELGLEFGAMLLCLRLSLHLSQPVDCYIPQSINVTRLFIESTLNGRELIDGLV